MARRIPGFAGYYLDGNTLVVGLIDLTIRDAALAITRDFLHNVPETPGLISRHPDIRFVPATYAFDDLSTWRETLNTHLLATSGVQATWISRVDNHIAIAVDDISLTAQIATIAESHDIPLSALRVHHENRFELNSDTLLWQFQRPVSGGISLVREWEETNPDSSVIGCSAGVLAKQGSQLRLLTAGHCSNTAKVPYTTDYTMYFNHRMIEDTLYYVGLEYYDPSGWNCWQWAWPPVRKCRHSDAAILALGTYVETHFGHIIRPKNYSVGWQVGSRTIDPANPHFRIVGVASNIVQNMTVHKVGQRGGWTSGLVTAVGVDAAMPGDKIVLDVARGSYFSADGDSGGPVFASPNQHGHVWLLGIHFANQPSQQYSVFAPMNNVFADLGTLEVALPLPPTFSVSILGPEQVQEHQYCVWTSSVSSGSTPYQYSWRRDGELVSTASSYETFDTGAVDFTLELAVVDSQNQNGFDVLQVTVQGSGQFQCT